MQLLHVGADGAALPDLSDFEAVLFDLDGVLTPTAEAHMRAWEALFRPYLAEAGAAAYTEQDYFDHLDGKQRYQGVASLLASRGLELPWGTPDDPPEAETVCGLGNRKNVVFNRMLAEEGVKPYQGSVELLERLEAAGIKVAVVSSSRNAPAVLAAAGLAPRFEVVVDGASAAAEGLPSKPEPATYLKAAERLGVAPDQAVVVEDALSGVEAGRRGRFGLVVGVDRGAGSASLLSNGADLVVSDLGELAAVMRPPLMDRRFYPVDEWRVVERGLEPSARGAHMETIFALGNGYLGVRGNDEEGGPAAEHGTFINGFHETWHIEYPEIAYGFAEVGQSILNLPDAKTIELVVDGERLDLHTSVLSDYERVLDMRAGTLERTLVWHTPSGNRVRVRSRRMVSFERRHLMLASFTVTPLDGPAEVRLRSQLLDREAEGARVGLESDDPDVYDPRKSQEMRGALRATGNGVLEDGSRPYFTYDTRNSGMGLAVMAAHALEGADATPTVTAAESVASATYAVQVERGRSVALKKYVAYHDGAADAHGVLVNAASATLDEAEALGETGLLEEQRSWLATFWADADVTVPGRPAVQQALRWNLYQLLQATARADGRGVGAKGVTGSGYDGHYFWDTEIYMLPYLIHTAPLLARNALKLRYSMLPAARRRASTMSEAGALFPWRTINGEEASAYYPAGTAQYHINADVAYAVTKYVAATGDSEFMQRYGAEILVETARLWASLGYHDPDTGAFHINGVTGPDEYSAVVDDNFYTNVMAAGNLRAAAEVLTQLEMTAPEDHARLVSSLALEPHEPERWLRAAGSMTLMRDAERGIHLQDARWLDREPWDFVGTPPDKYPLLLHFHPLVIYRHQVLKQADLVLALYLQSRLFTLEQKRADFEYYDPLTTGDSSLSAAVQSIIAAEVGREELALEHFEEMLYADLADLHGNTVDGVHVASTGGTWQALVAGFGGMRDDGGTVRFDPRLPAGWQELRFLVRTGGAKVRVTIRQRSATFVLEDGASAVLEVRGRKVELNGPQPVTVAL